MLATPGPRGGGVYYFAFTHINTDSRTHTYWADTLHHMRTLVLVSDIGLVLQRSGECEGRGGRVSAGSMSCISLSPSLLAPPTPSVPLPLIPMPCQIHISHNRTESPCQQHCIHPTALSCSRSRSDGGGDSFHPHEDTVDVALVDVLICLFRTLQLRSVYLLQPKQVDLATEVYETTE